jgi:hypothetical protein
MNVGCSAFSSLASNLDSHVGTLQRGTKPSTELCNHTAFSLRDQFLFCGSWALGWKQLESGSRIQIAFLTCQTYL